jgi:polysaccharide export outer membrane protein
VAVTILQLAPKASNHALLVKPRKGNSKRAFLASGLCLALCFQSGSAVFAKSPNSVSQSPAGLVQDAYILGPGDKLKITLLDPGARELGGDFEILNDGSASLALIGNVVLDGLTVNQAIRWLQSLYSRYLNRPELALSVVTARPVQVSVIGEVETPGLYSLSLGGESSTVPGSAPTIPGLPTLVSAIQKAGGLTLNADLSNVRLQRRVPGTTQQLRETHLNLASLLRTGDKTQNPFLFDGDTILVGKALTPDREVMELAATNFTPESISVTIVGEVVRPGVLSVKANTPLVQAVLAAGGPTNWRGNRSNVELVRINRNGTATRQYFNVNYSQGVNAATNPPLRDGDTVVVNRTGLAIANDALTALTTPLTGLVNIWALVRLIQDTN